MDSLETKLFKRAKASLENEAEVTQEVIQNALFDMNEAVKNKSVSEYIKLDFAYVRLKLYLKIGLNAQDEMLLNKALRNIEKAPIISEDGLKSPKFYTNKNRVEFL